MSFSRSFEPSASGATDATRRFTVHEEKRRAVDSAQLGIGTLACAACDAPVALGSWPHAPTQMLTCPFCAHRAPLREFLSLAAPSRPARVAIRLARRRG